MSCMLIYNTRGLCTSKCFSFPKRTSGWEMVATVGSIFLMNFVGKNIFWIRSTCTIIAEQVGKVKCTSPFRFPQIGWLSRYCMVFYGKCVLNECLLDCHRSTKNCPVSTKLHISKDCVPYSFRHRLVKTFVWSESECKVLKVTVRELIVFRILLEGGLRFTTFSQKDTSVKKLRDNRHKCNRVRFACCVRSLA